MNNRKGMTLELLIIGLIGVNFFYLSDMLFDDAPHIVLGIKSVTSIAVANAVALLGIAFAARDWR